MEVTYITRAGDLGLHLRVGSRIAKETQRYQGLYGNVDVRINDISGLNVLEMLTLGIGPKREVEVRVSGNYPEETLKQIAQHIGGVVAEREQETRIFK